MSEEPDVLVVPAVLVHCVRHRNTVRCHHRVHRCWCVARWLPYCRRVCLVLVLIVVVNVSLVAVLSSTCPLVAAVSAVAVAHRRRARRCCRC
jgi:hypothetical protein